MTLIFFDDYPDAILILSWLAISGRSKLVHVDFYSLADLRGMTNSQSRWVEVTVGVIGKRGAMHSLSPSITVKESSDILSLEEKFQESFDTVLIGFAGGTGINLTPPPTAIIGSTEHGKNMNRFLKSLQCRSEALQRCKERIELIANSLELEGFSRIDAFVNVDSGELLVIEVNTVPGMTPSTVLIHQVM
ncbi:hypothetical protein ACLOJK_023143 [Asimina triloba]